MSLGDRHPVAARWASAIALVAIWAGALVYYDADPDRPGIWLFTLAGAATITCLTYSLFRGPNQTGHPFGSDFAITVRFASIGLVLFAFPALVVAVADVVNGGLFLFAAVWFVAGSACLATAVKVLQVGFARRELIEHGTHVEDIFVGRSCETALEAYITRAVIVRADENTDQAILLHCRLGAPREFARVPLGSVEALSYDGRKGLTMKIDVGSGDGGVVLWAVPFWEWEAFSERRGAS